MSCRAGFVLFALIAAGAIGSGVLSAQESPPSTTDARIEYYKERLGGASTFPIYARLGAAYVQKARETGQIGYYREAEKYLLRSLEFQRNFEALHWLAVVYLAQHRFPEALRQAEEAAQTLPDDVNALGNLFDAQMTLGNHEKAEEVLERMRALGPGFAVSTREASLQRYRGNLLAAKEAIVNACEEAKAEGLPAETQAWCQVRLGSLSLALCEMGKVETSYRSALEHFPGYHLALEHLAELHAAQGRPAEAIEIYRGLLEVNPAPEYRLALADAYDLAGVPAQATRERAQALREMQDATSRGARIYLRPLALLLLQEKTTARDGLRLAERDWKNRQDAYAADTLAWAYLINGRRKDARRFAQKALAAGTGDPGILLHAARIYHWLRDRKRARTYLDQALSCTLALSPGERAAAERLQAELTRDAEE